MRKHPVFNIIRSGRARKPEVGEAARFGRDRGGVAEISERRRRNYLWPSPGGPS